MMGANANCLEAVDVDGPETRIPEEARIGEETAPPWAGVAVPDGYTLTYKGVEIDDHLIAGSIWVQALTRDTRNASWGFLVRWRDADGQSHELAVPRARLHEQGTALAQDLAAGGLFIVPGKERGLITYLGRFEPATRLLSVNRLGWTDGDDKRLVYVLPNQVLTAGAEAPDIRYQPERHSPSANTLRARRSLEDWQEAVALRCAGNPILVFALSVALAAPLLKAANMDGGGFHIYGASSRGKTTALQVAASVWGCGADPAEDPARTSIHRWNATRNGLEGLAAAHNDGLFALDELGTCNADDFGSVIYNLAGGQGKAAMDASRTLREPRAWRTMMLSTGELSAASKIQESRRTAKAGQLLRLMDIPITGGVIVDTHNLEAATFANRLKRACGEVFGTAGPALVTRLAEQYRELPALQQDVGNQVEGYTQKLTRANAPPEQQRAIRRLALVLTAGLFAQDAEVLPGSLDVLGAIQAVRDAWLSEGSNLPEGARALQRIRAFILANPGRFRSALAGSGDVYGNGRQLCGYTARNESLYLFTDEGLAEACEGIDVAAAAKELSRRGLLHRNDPKRLKSKHPVNVDGTDKRLWLYGVKAALLETDESETGTDGTAGQTL